MTGQEVARHPLPEALRSRPIAHRALHDLARGRPENSRAAIRAAMDAGFGIEIDLQLSADGRAMVFHDETLERLTEAEGPVAGRSAAELGRIALRGGTETIPTLAEVLAEVAGRVPLLIEFKDQTGTMGAEDRGLEAAAAADLAGYAGAVALMSFNPHSVMRLARLVPERARGLTTSAYEPAEWAPLDPATCERLRAIPDYDAAGCSFISHEWTDLGRPRVAEIAAAGGAVLCWTIRSPEAEATARRVACNVTFEGYVPR